MRNFVLSIIFLTSFNYDKKNNFKKSRKFKMSINNLKQAKI